MTVSRRLEYDRTHATTRRTLERRKFLNPRPGVRELVGYSLGRALELNPGVQLHAYVVSTSHPHALVTDRPVEGDASALPDFFRDHHSLTARAMNARLGRGGPFWTTGSWDNVELHGQLTIEQQLLYAWTNPVKDGLCEWPEEWAAAGLMFLPEDWGKTFTFRKPEGAFFGGRRPVSLTPTDPDALADWQAALRAEARDAERLGRDRARRARERAEDRKRKRNGKRGVSDKQRRQLEQARARRKKKAAAPKPVRASRSILPELVQVTPMPPPGHEHQPLDEVKAYYRKRLDEEVARIHAERRQRGFTTFIGIERIRQEDPREPAGDSFPTFARNPRIACRDR
jgi:hypothetical protein